MTAFLGTSQEKNRSILYYLQHEGGNTFLKVAYSTDGLTFDESKSKYIFAFDNRQKEEQRYDWESLRIARQEDRYFLTYKIFNEKTPRLHGALSADLTLWYKTERFAAIKETGAVIPQFQHNQSYVMYTGEKDIKIAYSDDLREWTVHKTPVLAAGKDFFAGSDFEVANAYKHDNKILLIFYIKDVHQGRTRFRVGAAYFDKANPAHVLWKSDEPLYELPEAIQTDTTVPLGTAILHDQLILYWKTNAATLFAVTCPIPLIPQKSQVKTYALLIKKFAKNPIISPRPHIPWESRATFNSAAIFEDGKVHFLYRALGDTDLSVLGYATSSDGLTIDHRGDQPAYIPREPFETPGNHAFSSLAAHFVSGGGYGGIEDPRIARVEDKLYLTYVAFDGATPPRAAISSIGVDDFLANDWEAWAKPKLISAPGMVNKSAVVFPRKVGGKYVVLHRVYPNILVDYLDDLEFNSYLRGDYFIPPRRNFWDSKKVGAGAPPIETKDGWLLIYQSVGYQDPSRYKIGAMLLDRDRPEKVLYRTHLPLIEPVEPYENNGFKAGVVYPCGAVIMKEKLFIYYGGADSYVNAAWADLDTLLYQMKRHREPKLHMVSGLMN
jgi:predicted GH43/DUF377 family glycosyl hydrolase